jgi:hypothetical protein
VSCFRDRLGTSVTIQDAPHIVKTPHQGPNALLGSFPLLACRQKHACTHAHTASK